MKRRTLLSLCSSAAGAAVLGPFFSSLANAQPRAAPRFVFFVEGNGFEPYSVLSPSTRAALDRTLAAPIGTRPFWSAAYRHTALLETSGDLAQAPALVDLGALAAKTAVVLGLSSRITGGGHSAQHGVLSSCRTAGKQPTGETIDAHLAALPALTGRAIDAYRVGYKSQQYFPNQVLDYQTCALGPNRSAPVVVDPSSAFSQLFAPLSDAPAFAQGGRVLDFAREDVRRALAALPSSQPERLKLERYLESIEASLARRRLLAGRLGPSTVVPARPPARTPEDYYPVLRAQAGHVASALIGGITQVGVVAIGTGTAFDTFYDASHTPRHNSYHMAERSAGPKAYLLEQKRLQFQLMAQFAAQLEAVPEGNGTLLDHTVVVWVGDNGETHHAQGDEFPIVVMGGGALGLVTGNRTLVYPGLSEFGRGHRQVSNLWNTLGYLAGEALDLFGGERFNAQTRSSAGPLSALMAP